MRSILLATAAIVSLSTILAAPASVGAASVVPSGCPGADRALGALTVRQIARSLRCLHVRARRDARLPPLRRSGDLERVGTAKARVTARTGVFSHAAPTGSFARRMRASAFARRPGWAAGENLARGDARMTPRGVMARWLASPGHRENILDPGFRLVGIGVARSRAGVVYAATVVGRR